MYSVKPSRCQNNNKTKKNTCKDTDTILRSPEIRIKKGKNFCKSIKFCKHILYRQSMQVGIFVRRKLNGVAVFYFLTPVNTLLFTRKMPMNE